MAEEILSERSGRGRAGRERALLAAYWFSFLLTMVLMFGCYAAAGATLGVFLGGLVVATVVMPGVVMAEEGWFRGGVAWAGAFDAALLVWLVPVFRGVISVGDWGEAVLVLAAYGAAVAALAIALRWVRVNTVLAAALAVVAGLAWLAWPVWMAPWLTGENRETIVAWLVRGHPVFALNGATLEAFGQPWAQMTIAYRLTNIGDDVGYEMPRSVWACVFVHALIAVMTLAPQVIVLWRKRGENRAGDSL